MTLSNSYFIGIRFLIKPDTSRENTAGKGEKLDWKGVAISLFFGLTTGFGTGFVGTGGGMMSRFSCKVSVPASNPSKHLRPEAFYSWNKSLETIFLSAHKSYTGKAYSFTYSRATFQFKILFSSDNKSSATGVNT